MRWIVLFVSLAGCFTEPVVSQQCPDGTAGCDCANGGCDADLECVASIEKCVPVDCTPGESTCVCGEGEQCFAGLQCRDGVCAGDDSGTTGDATPMGGGAASTTVDPTTASSTTASTTSMGPSESSTGEGNESSTSTGTPATSSSGDEPVDCTSCIQVAAGNSCASQFVACNDPASDPCGGLYQCVFAKSIDYASCCASYGAGGGAEWNALIECANMYDCMDQCPWVCM